MNENPKTTNPLSLPENQSVVYKLVLYSILMFLIPICVYFLIFFFFTKILVIDNIDLVISFSALSAVLTTICIMIGYVISAYKESDEQKEKED